MDADRGKTAWRSCQGSNQHQSVGSGSVWHHLETLPVNLEDSDLHTAVSLDLLRHPRRHLRCRKSSVVRCPLPSWSHRVSGSTCLVVHVDGPRPWTCTGLKDRCLLMVSRRAVGETWMRVVSCGIWHGGSWTKPTDHSHTEALAYSLWLHPAMKIMIKHE